MASLAEKRVADDEATPADPQSRPEELRLLEALLFASAEPIDQATLAKRLPDGVVIKAALAQLQADAVALRVRGEPGHFGSGQAPDSSPLTSVKAPRRRGFYHSAPLRRQAHGHRRTPSRHC